MPTELTAAPQRFIRTGEPDIELRRDDRILVLAPHPDDESLACAGVIQRGLASGLPVHVVFLTLGDNNEWSFMVYRKRPELLPSQVLAMGEVRHDEGVAAARALGLAPSALTFLGYPDFGTLHIWCAHWGDAPPFRSMLTRVSAVPYATAYRPHAPYKGEEILRDLTAVLREFRPTRIFVSHAADHNPDHAALYLFTRLALWDIGDELRPQLHPYLIHYPSWPRPRGLVAGAPSVAPEPLSQSCSWQVQRLGEDEITRKVAALQAHQTQYGYCRNYLESFVRTDELYGDFAAVRLAPGRVGALSPATAPGAPAPEPAEELEEAERARFVSVESNTVRLVGNDLVFLMTLSRPLPPDVTTNFYCFGYRTDRPFADMPKLRVEVAGLGHRVVDLARRLEEDDVEIRRGLRDIRIRVPLEKLGQPQAAFLGAVTYLGDLPLSAEPWRILELSAGRSATAGQPLGQG
jgi:LmbE family N-acetylglucosaminyl deacetylase